MYLQILYSYVCVMVKLEHWLWIELELDFFFTTVKSSKVRVEQAM